MGHVLFLCALTVWLYMTAWFILALLRKDNSVADVAWGLGFVLLAGLTLVRRNEYAARQILVSGLVLFWGIRLAVHIFSRNRKRGEDRRYAEWRAKWGRSFVPRSYLQVFILQGVFLLVISLPVILVNSVPQKRLGGLDVAAALVWLTGFVFETAADRQLVLFKKDPANRGKIMTSGLWKYTRHPNYFGEAVMWWGIFGLALSTGNGWLTAASPLLITFLLRFVSGVPLLEKKYRRNAEFEEYARRTNAFIPWLPKT
jgi:steroid 5-alpha reductase family enzyme